MRTALAVGAAGMAEIQIERMHYGKLAAGAARRIPPSAGYDVTRRSRGLDSAHDRALLPPRVLGLRRFEPHLIDAQATRAGCVVARAAFDGADACMVLLRARFRPEDGDDGHGRLHQQSAIWVVNFEDWRRHPAALLAFAAADLQAQPDLVSEHRASRFGEAPLRRRFVCADPHDVRRRLACAPWASSVLELLARGAETGEDAVATFGGDDFAREDDFLAAVGLVLQFLPESYPRWRDITIVSGLRHAPPGLCLRYLPTARVEDAPAVAA